MTSRTPIAKTDDLDILSAIWILSCNDENPIITYKGISARLELPDAFDVRALVRSRTELFRPGVLHSRLGAWKEKMMNGRSRPGWILEIKDASMQDEAIANLTKNDVFRNQFRTEDGAPKCTIEIIDWGLNHIDRLRKSAVEEREARAKRLGTVVIPLLSVMLALISVSATAVLQWKSIREQGEMKRYEVSFRPKQESYSKFMFASTSALVSASAQEKENVLMQLLQAEQVAYQFEPFLNDDARKEFWAKYSEFASLCIDRSNLELTKDSPEHRRYLANVGQYKVYFQKLLYDNLFVKNEI
jgi:hypothetical protein